MQRAGQFRRYLLFALDMQAYGQGDDLRQDERQRGLVSALESAIEAAGLDRSDWMVQGTGDAVLALVPDAADEPLVVDALVRELDLALWRYNRDRVPEARMRLRMAFHHGMARRAANGYAGLAVVVVARLLDSGALRSALNYADETVNLAVAVSRQIYQDTILPGHTSLRPEDFQRVHITVKEFSDDAWIRVVGARDNHATARAASAVEPPAGPTPEQTSEPGGSAGTSAAARAPATAASPVQEYHLYGDNYTNGNQVLGNVYQYRSDV
jgi:hypothetical protein